ncbi:NEDD4-binding protein 2 [Oratosquilla oratoria]|uniref:NEDD4-binding protein 2 n=1 Tax=Oratosquilla oratoria TaxID=337810 RepID=UPI003F76D0AD
MAGEDNGALITKFDEVFNGYIDHEVIKAVLQYCQWDAEQALQSLLGMVEVPESVLVRALAISTSLFEGTANSSCLSKESEEQQIQNSVLSTNGSRPSNDTQEEVTPGWSVWPGLSSSLIRTHSCIPATKASAATFKWSEINEVPPPTSTKPHGRQNLQDTKELTNAGRSDGGNNKKSTLSNCVGESQFDRRGSSGKTFPVLGQERQETAWPVQQLSGGAVEGWYPSSSLHYTSANNASTVKKSDERVSKKDEIKNKILLGDKLVVLMRGLPGSGKSTLAQEITGRNGVVLSTDDFHYDKHGCYNYKPSRLSEAHGWNKNRTLKHLREGTTPIIIDNTNLQKWEMTPYIQMAIEHGYEVDILEPSTSWRLNSAELAKRNVHNVPKTKIKEMKERYQKDLKIEDLISQLRISTPEESNDSSSYSENYAESSKSSVTKESSYEGLAKHKPTTGLSVIKHYMRVNSAFYETEKEEDDYEDDVVIESSEEEEEGNASSHDTSKEIDVHQHLEIKDVLGDQKIEGQEGNKVLQNDAVMRNTHVENFDGSGMLNNYDGDQEEADVEEKTNRPSAIEEQKSMSFGTVGQDKEGKGSDCKEIPKESVFESIEEQPRRDDLGKETDQQTLDLNSSCKEEISLSPALVYNDLCSLISKATNALEEDNGEEWKDVLSDETPSAQVETIEDANFSDLVQTFNKALRFQLDIEIDEASSVPKKDDHVSDDLGDVAMYSLISDMEDKLGRPLSSLVTRPSGKGEELQLLNISEIGQNMIRENENSHQQDHEPSVVEQYTSEGQLCNDSVGIGTNVDGTSEKKEDGNAKERIDGSCSWGCLDTQATVAATWEEEKEVSSDLSTKPQPSRNSRRREGDKWQWLKVQESNIEKEVFDDEVSQWKPVLNAETTWGLEAEKVEDVKTWSKPSPPVEREGQLVTPPPQSGAVPKRKATTGTPCLSYSPTKELSHTNRSAQLRQDGISSEVIDQEWNMPQYPQSDLPEIPKEIEENVNVSETGTQTLSQDFQVLEGKSNVHGNMIRYANVGGMVMDDVTDTLTEVGPLTKHKLRLDKSTMTVAGCSVVEAKSLQNLTAFFPSIPEDHLKDVLEKCRYDLDWAMNLLLDGGYEMADSVPDLEKEVVEDDDWKDSSPDLTESCGTESTGDDKNSAECIDSSNELSDHQGKKLRQSQRPDLLATKKAIEETVTITAKLDERGNRLTGGECIKKKRIRSKRQTKTTEKNGSGTEKAVGSRIEKATISVGTEKVEQLQDSGNIDGEDESGLISLTMDPLFASQLVNLFGPIGPYKIDDLTEDDYNVIIPVSLCRQVYQLWSKTLEGKFHHESEVMDSYIKDDQQLAEKLQAEENAKVGKRKTQEEGDITFQMDPPNSFKEIMELEEALAESRKDGKGSNSDSNLSHRLNILRLQEEYSHLDPNAIEEEFKRCDYNYKDTVALIQDRYGSEGYPKTVIAPEAMHHYEQVMLEKAKALSLRDAEEQQKVEEEVACEVNDPQVYREEAIAHYQQRQNAFRKAQEASRQGMKAVAAYYAQIGNLHATRLREANKRASEKILEAVNSSRDGNTLDLHYLHVTEAVSVTQAFLSERQRLLRARNLNIMHVSLITGRGANSEGGVARIKPAVKEFLQKNGYSHIDGNSGMVVVTLKQ